MSSGLEAPEWVFRVSFIRLYSIMAGWAIPLAVIANLFIAPLAFGARQLPGLIFAVSGALLFMVPCAAVIVMCCTVRVGQSVPGDCR